MALVPLASILVVFGLLAGVLWWLRRLGLAVPGGGFARGRSPRLESLDRLALGPQYNLHLVRVDRSVVLVACSPAGCVLFNPGEVGRANHNGVLATMIDAPGADR
jgi:flagellar biogenesis protein FliO